MACQPNQLNVFSFCPTRFERSVPFPAGLSLVIAVSGVIAEKTAAAKDRYNAAATLAREAASVLGAPHLAAALQVCET